MAPITTADIELRLTIKTATAGNQLAQASGALSLGKWISTTVAPTTLNGLFPLLAAADNAAATLMQYLGLALYNKHATNTWRAPRVPADYSAGLR